ncbi:Iron-sulfur cluster repair protein YtfE [bacterium HR11]|nr:Iron-sulfur cluster repair protein YtfE [bacterium HR11]
MSFSVADFMSHDHDRLDALFEEFRRTKTQDLPRARRLFDEFRSGLERHIVWEEDILFPAFEARTGMHEAGPTVVMRMEHRQIRELLAEIARALEAGRTDTDALEQDLLQVLGVHNSKEEGILYPWIDRELSDDERQALATQLRV